MIKDLTLFNSALSKAQIKAEAQSLVSQTVQIGPVIQNNAQTFQNPSLKALNEVNESGSKTLDAPTQMKVPFKTIEQLIIHNSDTAVKPIVGNKEIERIQEEPFDAS